MISRDLIGLIKNKLKDIVMASYRAIKNDFKKVYIVMPIGFSVPGVNIIQTFTYPEYEKDQVWIGEIK